MCMDGPACKKNKCSFAHKLSNLRSTRDLFKLRMCLKKKCIEIFCRHAHFPIEISLVHHWIEAGHLKVHDSSFILHREYHRLLFHCARLDAVQEYIDCNYVPPGHLPADFPESVQGVVQSIITYCKASRAGLDPLKVLGIDGDIPSVPKMKAPVPRSPSPHLRTSAETPPHANAPQGLYRASSSSGSMTHEYNAYPSALPVAHDMWPPSLQGVMPPHPMMSTPPFTLTPPMLYGTPNYPANYASPFMAPPMGLVQSVISSPTPLAYSGLGGIGGFQTPPMAFGGFQTPPPMDWKAVHLAMDETLEHPPN